MDYQQKIDQFDNRKRDLGGFPVTKYEELPYKIGYGSSTGHPEFKGWQTADGGKVWCKWKNYDWFRPYSNWNIEQIESMIRICTADNQVEALFELLSAKRENK